MILIYVGVGICSGVSGGAGSKHAPRPVIIPNYQLSDAGVTFYHVTELWLRWVQQHVILADSFLGLGTMTAEQIECACSPGGPESMYWDE